MLKKLFHEEQTNSVTENFITEKANKIFQRIYALLYSNKDGNILFLILQFKSGEYRTHTLIIFF